MSPSINLAANDYEECPGEVDDGWVRCTLCRTKVYAGSNRTDIKRHEEACEYR